MVQTSKVVEGKGIAWRRGGGGGNGRGWIVSAAEGAVVSGLRRPQGVLEEGEHVGLGTLLVIGAIVAADHETGATSEQLLYTGARGFKMFVGYLRYLVVNGRGTVGDYLIHANRVKQFPVSKASVARHLDGCSASAFPAGIVRKETSAINVKLSSADPYMHARTSTGLS